MKKFFGRLWRDDQAALLGIEYLFMATILIIGTVVGLANLRDAVNTELTTLGNAILALNQGFTVSGTSGGSASTDGSSATTTPTTLGPLTLVPPAAPSVITAALPQ